MSDAMLFRAHVLSSLCDLQLQHEFGEEPLPIESLERLSKLGKILNLTLPPEVRHPWPPQSRHHAARSRTLVEVFQSALGCEECEAQSCPVKAMMARRLN